MLANDTTVPVGFEYAGGFGLSHGGSTLAKSGSRGDASFDPTSRAETAKCPSEGINHRGTGRRGSHTRTSISGSASSNIPNPTCTLGVHQLERIDLEPSSGQPTDRGRRSLPNLELHVGQVQDRLDALVDT